MAMGKVTCTCQKCGKEFVKREKRANRADAISWEKWAAGFYDTCYDCWKEEQEARDEALVASYGPAAELEGTEKQIAWAKKLRIQAVKAAREYAGEHIKPEQAGLVKEFIAYVLETRADSRFWIDGRDVYGKTYTGSFFSDKSLMEEFCKAKGI